MTSQYYESMRFNNHGFATIEVLPFLVGRILDDYARGWVYALRPDSVRVSTGEITTDSCPYRVTIFIGARDVIERIEQEVCVGLPDGFRDGRAMMSHMESRGTRVSHGPLQFKEHAGFGIYVVDKEQP